MTPSANSDDDDDDAGWSSEVLAVYKDFTNSRLGHNLTSCNNNNNNSLNYKLFIKHT